MPDNIGDKQEMTEIFQCSCHRKYRLHDGGSRPIYLQYFKSNLVQKACTTTICSVQIGTLISMFTIPAQRNKRREKQRSNRD